MATAAPRFAPGQIWQDNCYYLNRSTGACERKYVLVLAVDTERGDVVTAVFTSKSHGLTQVPACCSGPPRAGFFVGEPGGVLRCVSRSEDVTGRQARLIGDVISANGCP